MATTVAGLFVEVLLADATYMSLSTGGVVELNGTGNPPVNPTDTPSAYDTVSGVEVFRNPVTTVSVNQDNVVGPAGIGLQLNVRLSVYQGDGKYASTGQMLDRARALFHGPDGEMWFSLSDGRQVVTRLIDTPFRQSVDTTIKGVAGKSPAASMESARYEAVMHIGG